MIEVYFDGASAGNPGPSGAGIFIKGNGQSERFSVPLEDMSNHEAEFHAFIIALEICIQKKWLTASFRTDSELVNRSIEKEFVKNKQYKPLFEKALLLTKEFDLFFLKWVPSSENKNADELAKKAIQQVRKSRKK